MLAISDQLFAISCSLNSELPQSAQALTAPSGREPFGTGERTLGGLVETERGHPAKS